MCHQLPSAQFGLPPDTPTNPPPGAATRPVQPEFELFYRQLDRVFGGDKAAADKAVARLRRKLKANQVTDAATGAPLTLQMCQLYAEYGSDREAARQAYYQQQHQAQQQEGHPDA